MNSYEWIMYAGIAVWTCIGLYVFLLGRRQAALARRINQLSSLVEEE